MAKPVRYKRQVLNLPVFVRYVDVPDELDAALSELAEEWGWAKRSLARLALAEFAEREGYGPFEVPITKFTRRNKE